jgi:5-(carboxyamino)imidazole ribonucleotide synthase
VSPGEDPIAPPATIGMLGGGQLGRYAVVAARLAGYRTVVLDPDPAAPAGAVADDHLVAQYDDGAALDELASRCSAVTTEFENPPAAALQRLARDVVVAPPVRAVAIAQDRIAEKSFLETAGFPVAPFAALIDASDLGAAADLGGPAIVKTARLGYDGKGQRSVTDAAGIGPAWDQLGRVPCIVERRLRLDVELSVVLARRSDGDTATYAVAENVHRDGILDLTAVPARVDGRLAAEAQELAAHIAEALDYVGVLAVELFVADGRLVVNELAPRPHNSGHWTLDGSQTSQFAQQIRSITGAALGTTRMTVPAVAMVNLLGDLWFPGDGDRVVEPSWSEILADPGARLHLYGKTVPRPGRKMGHLTVLGDDVDEVAARATSLRRGVRRETATAADAPIGDDRRMQHPPERIEVPTAGAVLRRHQPGDVDALQAVIESSRDHLRPFMPWADQDRAATADFVAKTADGWASGDNYSYLVTAPGADGEGERLLGGCGLHRRSDPDTIEIGYWLRPDAVGRGTMTAAARALATVAFELDGISRVEIRCDVANRRSAAIPKRLGFVHVGDEEHEPVASSETGRRQIWACTDRSIVTAAAGAP